MNFLLTGRQMSTRSYVEKIEAETIEEVLSTATQMRRDGTRDGYTPEFLVNLKTGQCLRIKRVLPSERKEVDWSISDSAYDIVGCETPDEYFEEASE